MSDQNEQSEKKATVEVNLTSLKMQKLQNKVIIENDSDLSMEKCAELLYFVFSDVTDGFLQQDFPHMEVNGKYRLRFIENEKSYRVRFTNINRGE